MGVPSLASPPPLFSIRRVISAALEEDLAYGDLTSTLLIPPTLLARADIIAKAHMIVAGVAVAREVFQSIDSTLELTTHAGDGSMVRPLTTILSMKGKAQSLLQGERIALNFLQRLSGISTLTHQFCEAVRDYPVALVDTRKTTPGLRALEKWAVRLGGGKNHRFSLHDGILIKDNHLMVMASQRMNITQTCLWARQHAPHGLQICVEVETIAQVRQALKGKADVLLLDNMTPRHVKQAIDIIQKQALVEVSGGMTLDNVRDMAEAGPDFISIGALTHSAPSMDLSMEIVPLRTKRRPQKRQR
ncbi:carboxylating nicotinate-nucleotide diphosphorylase [Candidatus Nitrospira allomarina]|uniref:Probable nicotinate-nucleotide pyrophosphorylase [carboxylating] n=1 Tax=Candidatus Nitrospira allomarina TaxID=3020900 RepID=A0AA96GBA0_9BACT|nr:carboxylating nicotinate-nucleotide diphosphorylase [Candidatus Nitrospira allomarina]WNM56995.1 carboxylating nicotinate-nucleotide diphosphorylase [Candidatus Nitrospira allomarina]